MPLKTCSICSLPADQLQAVNTQMLAGVSPQDIAKQIGKHRSILYRHKSKCLPRTTLQQFKEHQNSRGPVALQTADGRNFYAFSDPPRPMSDEDFAKVSWVWRLRYQLPNKETPQSEIIAATPAQDIISGMLSREQAQQLRAKMAGENKPATDEAEQVPQKVGQPNAAPEEKKLTPRQSERYKWLHAPLGLKHD